MPTSSFRVASGSGRWHDVQPLVADPQRGWTSPSPPAAHNGEPGVVFRSAFQPYLAAGTVFQRSVAAMPLAAKSGDHARWMALNSPYVPGGGWGARTSLNTTSYNIPIYLVDSTVPGARLVQMSCGGLTGPGAAYCNGQVPWPAWATPAPSGDRSIAIYDLGTGIMREYFLCEQVGEARWKAATGGYYLATPGAANLAVDNEAMRLTQGSSSVVGMLNPLSQIGIAEARSGHIGHAVSVTMANAALPDSRGESIDPTGRRGSVVGASWPARSGDGDTEVDNTLGVPSPPIHGQWFRLPGDLDLDRYRPFTRMIIEAVQTYGGYGADSNNWCHAFNAEPGQTHVHAFGLDPWSPAGDVHRRFARLCANEGRPTAEALDVSDFPWEKTQWAPRNWGKPADPPGNRI